MSYCARQAFCYKPAPKVWLLVKATAQIPRDQVFLWPSMACARFSILSAQLLPFCWVFLRLTARALVSHAGWMPFLLFCPPLHLQPHLLGQNSPTLSSHILRQNSGMAIKEDPQAGCTWILNTWWLYLVVYLAVHVCIWWLYFDIPNSIFFLYLPCMPPALKIHDPWS